MKVALKPSALEYQTMFDEMIIDTTKQDEINEAIYLIKQGQSRYQSMCDNVNTKCEWYAIGIVHFMECSCDFNQHIHNGNPLTAKTFDAPSGRPINGNPPYTWEESCTDWMNLKGWNRWVDWGITDILARLEMNNGLGYRHHGIATPYLFSYTNLYTSGKYISDGTFDINAVSKQVGAAILLKELTIPNL
jgi:lysozyme family protein